MPEPTEGPWSAPPSGAYGQWPVLGPNCETIAFATAQPGDQWKAAANARRMAAAPDMEKALESMLSEHCGNHECDDVVHDLARTALAKAKGE